MLRLNTFYFIFLFIITATKSFISIENILVAETFVLVLGTIATIQLTYNYLKVFFLLRNVQLSVFIYIHTRNENSLILLSESGISIICFLRHSGVLGNTIADVATRTASNSGMLISYTLLIDFLSVIKFTHKEYFFLFKFS